MDDRKFDSAHREVRFWIVQMRCAALALPPLGITAMNGGMINAAERAHCLRHRSRLAPLLRPPWRWASRSWAAPRVTHSPALNLAPDRPRPPGGTRSLQKTPYGF